MSIRKTIFTVAVLCCMLQASVFAVTYGNQKPDKYLGRDFVREFLCGARGN